MQDTFPCYHPFPFPLYDVNTRGISVKKHMYNFLRKNKIFKVQHDCQKFYDMRMQSLRIIEIGVLLSNQEMTELRKATRHEMTNILNNTMWKIKD